MRLGPEPIPAMRWLSVLFLLAAMAAGAACWLQRETAADLRDDRARLLTDRREIARLREENQRLAAALPPAETIEALRADRAAVGRMRREIEKTRENVQARERALAAPPAAAPAAPVEPALKLTLGVSVEGQLTSGGQSFDPVALRRQLAVLPRGSVFELRLQLPKTEGGASFDKVKQGVDVITEQAKQAAQDLGLKMNLRTTSPRTMEPAQP